MPTFDYSNTYWAGKGKHEALSQQLAKLIPPMGEVDDEDLEELRQANNAYYDLYNNGGGNRDAAILYFSGVDTSLGKEDGFHTGFDSPITELLNGEDWDEVAEAFEPAMDELVIQAALEQDLIEDFPES